MTLFIGGSMDGRRLDTPDMRPQILVPTITRGRVQPPLTEPNSFTYQYEIYELHRFRGSDTTFPVYVLKGMTGDQMIGALLERYPAWAAPEDPEEKARRQEIERMKRAFEELYYGPNRTVDVKKSEFVRVQDWQFTHADVPLIIKEP